MQFVLLGLFFMVVLWEASVKVRTFLRALKTQRGQQKLAERWNTRRRCVCVCVCVCVFVCHVLIVYPRGAVVLHRVQISIVAGTFMKAAAFCVPWAT